MPQGGIIQVQYTQFTGTSRHLYQRYTDTVLTDLTVNITPASTSSVIHLQSHIFCEFGNEGNNDWESRFLFLQR